MKSIVVIDNSSHALENIRLDLMLALSRRSKVNLFVLQLTNTPKLNSLKLNRNLNIKKLTPLSIPYFFYSCLKSKLLFSFTLRPFVIGSFVKFFVPRIRFYPTITGTGPLTDSNILIYKFLRFIYPFLIQKADHLFLHNQSDAKYFKKFYSVDLISVVGGSGIDLPELIPTRKTYSYPSSLPLIACFSRMLIDKGILEYLDATKMILNNYPEMKGNIILAGSFYNSNLRSNLIELKDIEEWVKNGGVFIGQPPSKRDFYSKIDFICQPSYREGLSNVLLEAGSYGCLLMASSVPGCIDVVTPESGLIFEPRTVSSLYRALEKAIKLSPERQSEKRKSSFIRLKQKFLKSDVISSYLQKIV